MAPSLVHYKHAPKLVGWPVIEATRYDPTGLAPLCQPMASKLPTWVSGLAVASTWGMPLPGAHTPNAPSIGVCEAAIGALHKSLSNPFSRDVATTPKRWDVGGRLNANILNGACSRTPRFPPINYFGRLSSRISGRREESMNVATTVRPGRLLAAPYWSVGE
jgi:hypothetical protein